MRPALTTRPAPGMHALSLIAVLAAVGCTSLPPPAHIAGQRLTPSPDIRPNFAVPGVRERMIHLARQEWALFGRPVVDGRAVAAGAVFPDGARMTHEVQPDMLSRVLTYWYAVTDLPVVGHDGALRPWSAAFVSWLARSAGIPPDEFRPSVLHWDYIEDALEARTRRFVARDAAQHAPVPGDLLCAPRGEVFAPGVTDFGMLRRGTYHCDLVVSRDGGTLEVIGGNVFDTVALTRVALDSEGRAVPSAARPWRIVLQHVEPGPGPGREH